MLEQVIDAGEFWCANCNTLPWNIVKDMGKDEPGRNYLSKIAEFTRLTIKNVEDMKVLGDSYLVWYRPNPQGRSGWEIPGSMNYKVSECYEAIKQSAFPPPCTRQGLRYHDLVGGLKSRLKEDVTLIAAYDTHLGTRLLVDGCKRAVALTQIAREEPSVFSRILESSQYRITIVQLKSRWAHCLYPADFLHLCTGEK